jgi:flagellar biosynthesis/type III secretory pathway protein FliH
MKILKEKETELIKLAVQEGILTLQESLQVDFKVNPSHLTVHQQHRLEQIKELLYTLFCEVVEENGVLQSEYDV